MATQLDSLMYDDADDAGEADSVVALMTKLTIAAASETTTRPMTEYRIVSLAFLTLPGSPVEVIYWMPPIMIATTATIAIMPIMMFIMLIIKTAKESLVLSSQPLAL